MSQMIILSDLFNSRTEKDDRKPNETRSFKYFLNKRFGRDNWTGKKTRAISNPTNYLIRRHKYPSFSNYDLILRLDTVNTLLLPHIGWHYSILRIDRCALISFHNIKPCIIPSPL